MVESTAPSFQLLEISDQIGDVPIAPMESAFLVESAIVDIPVPRWLVAVTYICSPFEAYVVFSVEDAVAGSLE